MMTPDFGTTFAVPGDTADVRAVAEVVMTLAQDGAEPIRWLVWSTDGRLWILTRSDAHPDIRFEGERVATSSATRTPPGRSR